MKRPTIVGVTLGYDLSPFLHAYQGSGSPAAAATPEEALALIQAFFAKETPNTGIPGSF